MPGLGKGRGSKPVVYPPTKSRDNTAGKEKNKEKKKEYDSDEEDVEHLCDYVLYRLLHPDGVVELKMSILRLGYNRQSPLLVKSTTQKRQSKGADAY